MSWLHCIPNAVILVATCQRTAPISHWVQSHPQSYITISLDQMWKVSYINERGLWGLEPASDYHSRNFSFWHFRVGVILQPGMLLFVLKAFLTGVWAWCLKKRHTFFPTLTLTWPYWSITAITTPKTLSSYIWTYKFCFKFKKCKSILWRPLMK